MHKLKNNAVLIYFVSIFTILILSNCQKNIENTSGNTSGEVSLNFTIEGINSHSDFSKNASKSMKSNEKMISKKLISDENGDYILSIYEDNNVTNSQSSINKLASSSPIDNNTKYRLVIHELNNDNSVKSLISNEVITGRSTFNINVEPNKKYRWIAYSNNNTNEPAAYTNNLSIIPSSIGTPSLPGGNDFIYASDIVTTSLGSNKVKILFKRQTANVRLIINTAGQFGTMDRMRILIPSGTLKRREFDLQTGNYTSESPYNTAIDINDADVGIQPTKFYLKSFPYDPISNNSGITPAIPLFHENELQYIDYFMPPSSVPFQFQIDMRRGILTRYYWKYNMVTEPVLDQYTNNSGYSSPSGNILFNAFTPEAGKRYLLKLDFIHSGFRVDKGTADEVIWSRHNVYAVRQSGSNNWIYRFQARAFGYADTTLYPYHKSLPNGVKIHSSTSTSSTLVETLTNYDAVKMFFSQAEASVACSQVYPTGYWRLPTVAESNRIIDYMEISRAKSEMREEYGGIYTVIMGLDTDQGSTEDYDNLDGGSESYHIGNGSFTHHGGMDANNQLQYIFLSEPSNVTNHYNSRGIYRTSGSEYMMFYFTGSSNNKVEHREVLNLPDIVRANVRCVKNRNYTP